MYRPARQGFGLQGHGTLRSVTQGRLRILYLTPEYPGENNREGLPPIPPPCREGWPASATKSTYWFARPDGAARHDRRGRVPAFSQGHQASLARVPAQLLGHPVPPGYGDDISERVPGSRERLRRSPRLRVHGAGTQVGAIGAGARCAAFRSGVAHPPVRRDAARDGQHLGRQARTASGTTGGRSSFPEPPVGDTPSRQGLVGRSSGCDCAQPGGRRGLERHPAGRPDRTDGPGGGPARPRQRIGRPHRRRGQDHAGRPRVAAGLGRPCRRADEGRDLCRLPRQAGRQAGCGLRLRRRTGARRTPRFLCRGRG